MKKIIRLTESDLHGIIKRSVKRVLREQQDKEFLLQSIAQSIIRQRSVGATLGDNDAEFQLQGGKYVYITYRVDGDPYMQKGMKSSSYDVPDDSDEIVDNLTVEIESISVCNDEGECFQIMDNGIVKQALERTIEIDYNLNDILSEEDYFNEY